MLSITKQTALLGMLACTQAEITGKSSGALWDNHDVAYSSTTKLGVENGVPYSNDNTTQARINAATAADGDMSSSYLTKSNVIRVKGIVSENTFNNTLFPKKNPIYTYEGFLQAVAKFPKFCYEESLSGHNGTEACKRELATLFAHFAQETGLHSDTEKDALNQTIDKWRQGLYHIHEADCPKQNGSFGSKCNDYRSPSTGEGSWASTAYPMADKNGDNEKDYYGRGPFQLSWNYNYGEFSEMLGSSKYDGKLTLLNDPDQMEDNAHMLYEAALWFYMTPQSPKPSMHQVVTGQFTPNSNDTSKGIKNGFGATIQIINGAQECNTGGAESSKAASRIDFYDSFLEHFGIENKLGETSYSKSCASMKPFPDNGAGAVYAYFEKDEDSENKCKAVTWQTEYSVYTRDDYKRCVCDSWSSNPAAECV